MQSLERLIGNHPEFLDFLTLPMAIILIALFTIGLISLFTKMNKHSENSTKGEQRFYAILVMVLLVGQIGNGVGLIMKKSSEHEFYENLETATVAYSEKNFDAHKITIQSSHYDGENYLVSVGLDNINHKTVVNMKYSHEHSMLIPYGKIDYETLPVKEGSPLESLIANDEHLSINSIDEMKEVGAELRTTGLFGIILAFIGVLLLSCGYFSFRDESYGDTFFFIGFFTMAAIIVYGVSYHWYLGKSTYTEVDTTSFAAYHIEENYAIDVPLDNMVADSFEDSVRVYTEDTPLEQYSTDALVFELDEDYNMFMIDHDETDLEKPLPVKEGSPLERLLETS